MDKGMEQIIEAVQGKDCVVILSNGERVITRCHGNGFTILSFIAMFLADLSKRSEVDIEVLLSLIKDTVKDTDKVGEYERDDDKAVNELLKFEGLY